MAHWRAILPREFLCELSYEALIADLQGETTRLLRHCGLDWDENCRHFRDNPQAVRTASAVQVRQDLTTKAIGRWTHYEKHLGALREILTPALSEAIPSPPSL
jgi:hypothetical protein